MKRIAALALLLSALAAQAQDSMSGVLYLTPGYTLTKTNGVAVNTLVVGRLVAATNTFGTNGTAVAPQMNTYIVDTITLTNGETRTYNLDALTNQFSQACDISRVNFLAVKVAASTNAAGPVTVGNLAAHVGIFGATNQSAAVQNGGCLAVFAPDATGWDANGKFLHLANGTNATAVEVHIGGAK